MSELDQIIGTLILEFTALEQMGLFNNSGFSKEELVSYIEFEYSNLSLIFLKVLKWNPL